MTYAQEQCACGFVQRVPEGELIPDGWHHLPRSGELVCPRCWNDEEDRRVMQADFERGVYERADADDDTRTRARGRDDG